LKINPSFLKRLCRATLSIIISGIVVKCTGDEKFIALAPALQAVSKYLRDKFNLTLPI